MRAKHAAIIRRAILDVRWAQNGGTSTSSDPRSDHIGSDLKGWRERLYNKAFWREFSNVMKQYAKERWGIDFNKDVC